MCVHWLLGKMSRANEASLAVGLSHIRHARHAHPAATGQGHWNWLRLGIGSTAWDSASSPGWPGWPPLVHMHTYAYPYARETGIPNGFQEGGGASALRSANYAEFSLSPGIARAEAGVTEKCKSPMEGRESRGEEGKACSSVFACSNAWRSRWLAQPVLLLLLVLLLSTT